MKTPWCTSQPSLVFTRPHRHHPRIACRHTGHEQWNDFIQDLDALVEDEVRSHYTGTVVTYRDSQREPLAYGRTKKLAVVDVVDGQQRLTTCTLYLSIIIEALIARGEDEYRQERSTYLHTGGTTRLIPNNDCQDLFLELLQNGQPSTPPRSTHQQRLVDAHAHLKRHLDTQAQARQDRHLAYLQDLFTAITQKLSFTYYAIEEECEIGMTFELMNSRGKDLSILELLKNYLMHWVSRNLHEPAARAERTAAINREWKATYTNLGLCNGDEDQCLRVAWTLHCSHSPGNWVGYAGFKQPQYIPLRDFSQHARPAVDRFIGTFSAGLAEISLHYSAIVSAGRDSRIADEALWLDKLHHGGNIANFLPLLIAARKKVADGTLPAGDYIGLLKALEFYAYRVFLFGGRRSNAGKSTLHRFAHELFHGKSGVADLVRQLYLLALHYGDDTDFHDWLQNPEDWYSERRLLKYTLFEYELHLLEHEGKGKAPMLQWQHLSESTLEHILPQNPAPGSHWRAVWKKSSHAACVHDIGNLVLTQNNSNYLNFDFARKKGQPGLSPSYAHSDIRQERKIALHDDWTPEACESRRQELTAWIRQRWASRYEKDRIEVDISDEADEG